MKEIRVSKITKEHVGMDVKSNKNIWYSIIAINENVFWARGAYGNEYQTFNVIGNWLIRTPEKEVTDCERIFNKLDELTLKLSEATKVEQIKSGEIKNHCCMCIIDPFHKKYHSPMEEKLPSERINEMLINKSRGACFATDSNTETAILSYLDELREKGRI